MRTYHRVLTIAGSDSGGGAGIQADLKTFAALGCYGMSAITALTAQNTVAVTGILPIAPEFVASQIDAVASDIGVDAVKIGMLHSAPIIRVVAERLAHHRPPHIVVDPVMVAKSGDRLLQEEAIAALRADLLPLATIITPNLPEAEVLLNRTIGDLEAMREAAVALVVPNAIALGPQAVLLKGGHLRHERAVDVLYIAEEGEPALLEGERIETENTHGTGCTLSSAIAAFLARGCDLREAVARAKAYLTAALRAGASYRLGRGHGPVHHFHAYWE